MHLGTSLGPFGISHWKKKPGHLLVPSVDPMSARLSLSSAFPHSIPDQAGARVPRMCACGLGDKSAQRRTTATLSRLHLTSVDSVLSDSFIEIFFMSVRKTD